MGYKYVFSALLFLSPALHSLQLDLVGNDTEAVKFPFLVSVREKRNYKCVGVIVAEKWILTSAFCAYTDVKRLSIQYGVNVPSKFGPNVISVNRTLIHPEWEIDIPLSNDLALLELKQRIPLHHETAYPVNLTDVDYVGETEFTGLLCTWPSKRHDIRIKTKVVQVGVMIRTRDDCEKRMPNILSSPNNICTKIADYNETQCFSYDGALIHQEHTNTLLGIATFHIKDCAPPHFYTNISKYFSWIVTATLAD